MSEARPSPLPEWSGGGLFFLGSDPAPRIQNSMIRRITTLVVTKTSNDPKPAILFSFEVAYKMKTYGHKIIPPQMRENRPDLDH
jgi:hypothetical protein